MLEQIRSVLVFYEPCRFKYCLYISASRFKYYLYISASSRLRITLWIQASTLLHSLEELVGLLKEDGIEEDIVVSRLFEGHPFED